MWACAASLGLAPIALPRISLVHAEPVNPAHAVEESRNVVAPPDFSRLSRGLTLHEVIRLWGAPDERKEREAKREIVWLYGETQIFFQNGKVVGWTSGGTRAVRDSPSSGAGSAEPMASPTTSANPPDDEAIRSILGEILERTEQANVPSPQTVPMHLED
jgi:hypothetical protein